jgi:hypothetical protein
MKKRSKKLIEKMIANIYKDVDMPLNNDPIRKETLEKIVRNIALEIVKSKAIASQAMY